MRGQDFSNLREFLTSIPDDADMRGFDRHSDREFLLAAGRRLAVVLCAMLVAILLITRRTNLLQFLPELWAQLWSLVLRTWAFVTNALPAMLDYLTPVSSTKNIDTAKDYLVALATIGAAALAILGVVFAVVYVIRTKHRMPELVIEESNASSAGDSSQPERTRVSLAIRERLVNNVNSIHHVAKYHKRLLQARGGIAKYGIRLPTGSTHTISEALEGLSTMTVGSMPSQFKWAMSFAQVFVRIRCTRVESTLQFTNNTSNGLQHVTFEISELGANVEPAIFTVDRLENEEENDLLDRAAVCLSLEVLEWRMLTRVPWRSRLLPMHRDHYRARTYNYIGTLYMSYYKAHDGTSYKEIRDGTYYEHASRNFRQAIALDPTWDQPYGYLADLHSLRGQELEKEELDTRHFIARRQPYTDLQYTAVEEYGRALRYALPSFPSLLKLEHLLNWMKLPAQRNLWRDTLHRWLLLSISKARAELLAGERIDPDASTYSPGKVINEIEGIPHHGQHASDSPKTKVDKFEDCRLFYVLACWHAVAAEHVSTRQDRDKQLEQAKFYLSLSLKQNVEDIADIEAIENREEIEDPDWYYWKRAADDPDLKSIRNDIIDIKRNIITDRRTAQARVQNEQHQKDFLRLSKMAPKVPSRNLSTAEQLETRSGKAPRIPA